MPNIKVLAVASGGGHLTQLLRLFPSFEGCETYLVTTIDELKCDFSLKKLFVVKDASRKEIFRLIILALQILWIILITRPDVVVTTGAAPGLIALRISKIFGSRTIWIDSIANAEELSLSGCMALKHADMCLTQWPDLARKYTGLMYKGSVL